MPQSRCSIPWLPAGAQPYAGSFNEVAGTQIVLARLRGAQLLFAHGAGRLFEALEGSNHGHVKACPLNNRNRLAVNAYLPHTAPVALGRGSATLGLGDRLGLCADAHLRAVAGSALKPVLAQQSLRELAFMGRDYDDMLCAAAWGALRCGYRGGYAADGDHLKTQEQISRALRHGCTMITLDCSDALHELPQNAPVHTQYAVLPQDLRERLEACYLDDAQARNVGIVFERETLERLAVLYEGSVALAVAVYRDTLRPHGRTVDFEISLDETTAVTTPAAHYFTARELTLAGVQYTGIAPRFVGEFQKGVEYIGDLDALREDLRAHARIAALFGHKLSIHSGSDKFSIYPHIARETGSRFHVKTSGTSWLEAVRVIAMHEPALYRRMHTRALAVLADARTYYTVRADTARIPPLYSMPDSALPAYLAQDDARQLMHITYGYLFSDAVLAADIRTALALHAEALDNAVSAHIRAHIRALGCDTNQTE